MKKNGIFWIFIFFIMFFVTFCIFTGKVNAGTITVDKYGSGDYEKIQDALDDASNGDTVYVYNGTYYENVVINKSINLTGEDRKTTIINGNYKGDVIYISAHEVNITNISIINSGLEGYPDHDDSGIEARSDSINIINCNISNNRDGIYLYSSSKNSIINCEIYLNDRYGIYLEKGSNENIISNCEISNNYAGIRLYGLSSYYTTKNTINNCNIYSNVHGIQLDERSYYNQVNNCSLYSNSYYGILFQSSENNQITNCRIYLNNNYGICLRGSRNIINLCNVSHNDGGIRIEHPFNKISNCNIYSNNNNGIYLDGSTSNQIINCNIYLNKNDGIHFYPFSSDENEIDNCTIYSNNHYGIYIRGSSNNIITNCIFYSNNKYGIYIWGSSDNSIHHNNFINNFNNAFDEYSNQWDDGSEGNYWDDYTGKDNDHNGIGDTSYDISGGDNQDNYPMMNLSYIDTTSPIIIDFSPIGNDIPVIINIKIKFSELMKKKSVENAISINPSITYSISWDGMTFNLNPTSDLEWNTIYNLTISTYAKDLANNPLEYTNIFNFSTEKKPPNILPKAVLSISELTIHTYVEITFNASASSDEDGSVIEFCFDFGDDNSSGWITNSVFKHSYSQEGTYTVTLKVKDNEGEESKCSTEVEIKSTPPIVKNITVNPENPKTTDGLVVSYEYFDLDGDKESGTIYKWYKNEGYGFKFTNLTTKEISFENTKKGEIWKCEVTPKDGKDFGKPINSTEIEIKNTNPVAKISYPKNGVVFEIAEKILFDASNSSDIDNDNLTFLWTFDGNKIAWGATPRFFSSNSVVGKHTIIVFVSDNDGGTDSAKVEITIKKKEIEMKPDLTISEKDIQILVTPIKGQTIKITAKIRNIGEVKATATIKFYYDETKEENLITLHTKIAVLPNGNITVTASWTPNKIGHHTIYVIIENCEPSEKRIDNNQAFKIIEVMPESKESGFIPKLSPSVVITICFFALVACFGVTWVTEFGRYKLLALLFLPLYVRLKKEKVLDNEIRGEIKGYIKANPGSNYSLLKKELNLPNGQLTYHLSVLERENLIKSRNDGKFKRFYSKEVIPPEVNEELSQIRLKIINTIEENPGISINELISQIGISRQLLNFHLRVLTNAKPPYIKSEKKGMKNIFFINLEHNGYE